MTTYAPFHVRNWNTPADYAAIADICNGIRPGMTSAALLEQEDSEPHPELQCCRRVAVDASGRMAGFAEARHEAWDAPGEWDLNIKVDVASRRQGIGGALYAAMRDELQARQATVCIATVRDDLPDALAFAQHRGFTVERHKFSSELSMADFDEGRFAGVIEAAQASGIRFFSFADTDGGEAQQRRLWELNTYAPVGQPGYDPAHARPFETFAHDVFGGYWFRPAGQIIAADGDRWIGMAAVGEMSPGVLSNMITCVYPAYRGRGIALALKLLTIRYAHQCGSRMIRTGNDSTNAPMLAINRKLGYKLEPGSYVLRCIFPVQQGGS